MHVNTLFSLRPAAALILMTCAGCTTPLLRADFNKDVIGKPPANDLAGAPLGDTIGIDAFGGGTARVVADPPPAGSQALELGGFSGADVGLNASSDFTTVAFTKTNFTTGKPVYITWTGVSTPHGTLEVLVSGKLKGAESSTDSGWRVIAQFMIENGKIVPSFTLGGATITPEGSLRVTDPSGGRYRVAMMLDEQHNTWRVDLLNIGSPSPGRNFSGDLHIASALRPELNFANMAPEALRLSVKLTDDKGPGLAYSYRMSDLMITQQQQ